jgi:hypothetical protein
MKIEPKDNCPLDNFNPCRQLDCAWFIKVPIMMIENSQMQRQTGAAVESFRNEMVKSNEVGQRVLLAAAGVPQQAQHMILESK